MTLNIKHPVHIYYQRIYNCFIFGHEWIKEKSGKFVCNRCRATKKVPKWRTG